MSLVFEVSLLVFRWSRFEGSWLVVGVGVYLRGVSKDKYVQVSNS